MYTCESCEAPHTGSTQFDLDLEVVDQKSSNEVEWIPNEK